MTDLTPDLWKLIDRQRAKGHRLDLLSMLEEAKVQGIPLYLEQVRSLIMRRGLNYEMFIYPDFLLAFIVSYLKDSAPQTILDCWTSIGAMLFPLAQVFKPTVAIGLTNNVNEPKTANLLYPDLAIDWRLDDPLF